MSLLLLMLLASAPVPAPAPVRTPVLTVEVQKLRGTRGHLVVMVFPERAAKDFPTRYPAALVTRTFALSEGAGPFVLEGLPPGRYALRVHHDENADGQLQKRLFIPQEGLAFSGGATLRWSGPPSFSEAAFLLSGDVTQTVVLTYP